MLLAADSQFACTGFKPMSSGSFLPSSSQRQRAGLCIAAAAAVAVLDSHPNGFQFV